MKFLRAGVIYAGANVASAAVPFLLLPLLTRMLTPDDYGRVVSYALLVTLCLTVVGLNAHAALGVIWYKRPHDQMPAYVGSALAIALGSIALIAPLVALVLWAYPDLAGGIKPGWGAAAAVTAGANVLLQCRLVLWQSQHKPVPNAILQLMASVLNVGLSLVGVLVLGWGGDGRNAGITAASCIMACVALGCYVRAGEMRWAPDREQFRSLAAFGLPLIMHSLAGVLLGTADRWMVSLQLGPHQLGIYGAGAQLGMVMSILADAFVKAYGPWLYARLASGQEQDKYSAVGAVYAAMPAFLCGAAVVGGVLMWVSGALLGAQYREATVVLPWFMLGGAFSGIYLCTSVIFFFAGRTPRLAMVTMSAALLGTASTWLLVSGFGMDGAAMGYAVTQGWLALFASVVAFRSFDLPWREPAKALAIWRQCALGRHKMTTN